MPGPPTTKMEKEPAAWVPMLRAFGQVALGAFLAFAGTSHLTSQREEFQAQVPSWFPIAPDPVVVASGLVELALGVALVATWKQPKRAVVGGAAAAFFVAVFPGNIAQFTGHVDAFGLDTDTKRAARLVFQPLLVAWALTSTDAIRVYKDRRAAAGGRRRLKGGRPRGRRPVDVETTRRPLATQQRDDRDEDQSTRRRSSIAG